MSGYEESRQCAIQAIHRLIARIEEEHRESDLWERHYFWAAIELLAAKRFIRVRAEIDYALEPPDKRGAAPPVSDSPILQRLTLAMMKKELEAASRLSPDQ
jgi:hypothetical protein